MATPLTTPVRSERRAARPLAALLLLVAGIAAAAIVNTIVSFLAIAIGADPAMGALSASVYIPFTVIGLLIAYAGWRLVRRLAPNPRRFLRVLVPVMLVVSWIPDILVGTSGSMAGVTVTGVVALMTMHLATVLVAVPTFQRIAPV